MLSKSEFSEFTLENYQMANVPTFQQSARLWFRKLPVGDYDVNGSIFSLYHWIIRWKFKPLNFLFTACLLNLTFESIRQPLLSDIAMSAFKRSASDFFTRPDRSGFIYNIKVVGEIVKASLVVYISNATKLLTFCCTFPRHHFIQAWIENLQGVYKVAKCLLSLHF